MLARHHFSQKQLHGIGTKEMLLKLESIGHHWSEEVTTENKYGNIFIREAYMGEGYNPKTKETVKTIRHAWFPSSEEQMREFRNMNNYEQIITTQIYKRLMERG